jgi:hypothetical protein
MQSLCQGSIGRQKEAENSRENWTRVGKRLKTQVGDGNHTAEQVREA